MTNVKPFIGPVVASTALSAMLDMDVPSWRSVVGDAVSVIVCAKLEGPVGDGHPKHGGTVPSWTQDIAVTVAIRIRARDPVVIMRFTPRDHRVGCRHATL
jgi:hypothetical protein